MKWKIGDVFIARHWHEPWVIRDYSKSSINSFVVRSLRDKRIGAINNIGLSKTIYLGTIEDYESFWNKLEE